MSTALAVHEPERRAPAPLALGHEPMDFGAMMQMAKVLVSTGFLPTSIKTPEQAVAIILKGRELGLSTMHALGSIHIIQGKPTLAAELQLALFHRAGGKSRVVKSTDAECEMWFRHPNGVEHVERFSIEDAKRAQLLNKQGDMYQKYPRFMLRWRTISGGLRVVAPEIVAGVYDPEELGAIVNEEGQVVSLPEPETPAAPVAAAAPANDVEWAKAFPIPFKKSPTFGKPLSEISSDGLRTIAAWVEEKRLEHGNHEFMHDLTDAIGIVLGDREKDQTVMELDEEPDVSDGAPHPTSTMARSKRISELLLDPRCAHLRTETRAALVNGMSDFKMQTTIAVLESLVADPKGPPTGAQSGDDSGLALGDQTPRNAVLEGH